MRSGGSIRWFGGVVVLAVALVAGCGGGSSGSGVPASTKVGDLTEAQKKSLCDLINGQQGGYGKSVMCSADNTIETDPDQATCVSGFGVIAGACPTLTAGDIEGCAKGPKGNACTFDTAPECKNVFDCYSSV